ncbi:MAG: D-2-hydroxyacid dehydrogenase family protein, partial [Acidimicrobiia bacterium]|nr:D-2-hydroxyacid dehydrogenase family protein [Acidimicrobiia bacterium]
MDEPVRVAILDDYQGVALQSADWSVLDGRAEPTVFRDHIADPASLAEALAPFPVVVAMRERTAFDRDLLERLPNLRLLVTTGMRNAAVDEAACAE